MSARRQVKQAVAKAARRMGYAVVRLDGTTTTVDMEPEFLAHYAACREFTLTTVERMYALYNAVRYVVRNEVPGALVECGVWRGGSAMLMARTLASMGVSDRPVYLYDTYKGMSEPTAEDGAAAADEWRAQERPTHNEWCFASLDEVRSNMARCGYPMDQVHLVEGKVEDTIPATAPDPVAVLRLDTDWYASTRHELEHLYPRLSPDGVLIIDDYGHWQGARAAVDEFFGSSGPLLHRLDSTGRSAQKPRALPPPASG